jgi:iron complex transport system permease protein
MIYWKIILLCLLAFIAFLLDIYLGSVAISFHDFLSVLLYRDTNIPKEWHTIIWDFRLPKVLAAVFCGMSLSVGGLTMQSIFRNPLAGPDVLGVSAGASMGIALGILSVGSIGYGGLTLWAAGGALAVLLIMLFVSSKTEDNATILIVGLMVAAVASAVVSLFQYFSGKEELKRWTLWSLGDVGSVTWQGLGLFSSISIIVFILIWVYSKSLDLLLLGNEYAYSMGVAAQKDRNRILILVAIITGTTTAFCGPISFLGIAVPHIARWTFKTPYHLILIPTTGIMGVLLMIICDIISSVGVQGQNLPINVLTSIIGAPIIIGLAFRYKNM